MNMIARGPFLVSPQTIRARKAIRKPRTRLFCKAGLSNVAKGWKIKLTVKFPASRRLCLENIKGIMSPEMRPKSFGTFEKQAPGLSCSRLDSAIQQINHYSLRDKRYVKPIELSSG